eukprot:7515769-Alexandrium_andersonii.AAC.1
MIPDLHPQLPARTPPRMPALGDARRHVHGLPAEAQRLQQQRKITFGGRCCAQQGPAPRGKVVQLTGASI